MITTLDLTQAARLFYGPDEVAELHRDGARLWPFGPDLLGWSGVVGASYYAAPETLFMDVGVTPAPVGERVRQINDRAGTGVDGGQSDGIRRPRRMAVAALPWRNLIWDSNDFSRNRSRSWLTAFGAGSEMNTLLTLDPFGGNAAHLEVEAAGTGQHTRNHQVNFWMVAGQVICASQYVKRGPGSPRNMTCGSGSVLTINMGATFDLDTGIATWTSTHGAGMESVGNGWWRIWVAGTALQTTGTYITWGFRQVGAMLVASYLGDGVSGLFTYGEQVEIGVTTPSPLQITYRNHETVFDAAGGNSESLTFGSTDGTNIATTLPAAVDGEVLIASPHGCAVMPLSAALGTLVRPYAITASQTGNAYQVGGLSPVIGWTIRQGGFSAADRDRLIRDYGRRGARGLLVPTGVDLLVNGAFDTDGGWTTSATGISWAAGQYTVADVAGVDGWISQQISAALNALYLVEIEVTANTAVTNEFWVRLGTAASQTQTMQQALPSLFTGTFQIIVRPTRLSVWISLATTGLNKSVTINSVRVRELVAAALP